MKKRMILFSLALTVLMLGFAGAAFAHWTKVITVTGYVETGNVDWEWEVPQTQDYYDQGNDKYKHPCTWNDLQGLKDVASGSLTRVDPTHLLLTMTNVYPMYTTRVSMHAHYLGSVPGIIRSAILYDCAGNEVLDLGTAGTKTIWENQPDPQTPDVENWVAVFEIVWAEAPEGIQMHYCNPYELSFDITALEGIRQDPDGTQGPEYCYVLELEIINYNEYEQTCWEHMDPDYIPKID